jgi:hypothetical protein
MLSNKFHQLLQAIMINSRIFLHAFTGKNEDHYYNPPMNRKYNKAKITRMTMEATM